jgi:transposase
MEGFFSSPPKEQRPYIETVATYMWSPYIEAASKSYPEAKIAFDHFHVVAANGCVIDKVSNLEYCKAPISGRGL